MSFSINQAVGITLLAAILALIHVSNASNEVAQCCKHKTRNKALYSLATNFPGTRNATNSCFTNQLISVSKKEAERIYSESFNWSQQNQFKVYPSQQQDVLIPIPDNTDVTLVTQLSLDRLSVFEDLCKLWTGPISAAIYVQSNYIEYFKKFVSKSKILSTRQNIDCHIVQAEGRFYPINYLRNVALQSSHTNYNFLVDVDFLPSKNLYENIRGKIAKYLYSRQNTNKKACLVIPAFELKIRNQSINGNIPQTKRELLYELDSGNIIPSTQRKFSAFHKPTNYTKWIAASKPYYVNWAPFYEPYIVIDKNAPKYNTIFVGYGFNKISHLMEVAASGYKFLVMDDSFIVHIPHPFSGDNIARKTTRYINHLLNMAQYEFVIDFRIKYGKISSKMVEEFLRSKKNKDIKSFIAFRL